MEKDGARVITRFPADELLVTGVRYWNGIDVPAIGRTVGTNGQPSVTPAEAAS